MSFKIKLIVSLIVVFYQYSIAQQGAPFITNFYTENESLNENFSIAEDKDGVIIIANRRGILTFDAEEWHLIKTPEIPLTVALNPIGGQVFVGCRNSAGLLVKNQTGDYEFQSLKSTTTGVVTQILFTTGLAYIISSEFITSVNLKTLAIESQIEADKDKAFLVAFVNNNKLFVDYQQLGLMTIESQELKQIKTKFDLSGRLTFTAKFDANTTLLGASDNKLYVFDGKKIQLYKVQDQQYLSDGGLSDARIIDSTKIAIATASAGCLVIEKQTGKTLFTINYQIGLPDDEVLALGTDRNHGIWISHNYGLSRIDGDIPVKNFSTYKGLTGNLQSAGMVNNRLYVTTGNGVYYLDKKKDYVEYTVKSNIETVDLKPVAQPTQKAENTQVTETNKRRSLFSRLFGKKVEDSQLSNNTNAINTSTTTDIKSAQKTTSGTRKVYKLQSESHYFIKIEGIEHKSRQILQFNNKLIIATVNGIFEIINNKAIAIISGENINYLYQTPSSNELYACTDKGIKQILIKNNKWTTLPFPVAQNEAVYSFAKDMFDNYWIGVENKVFKTKLNRNNTVKETKVYSFSAEYHERVIVRISNKKPLFFLNNSIYSIFNDSVQYNVLYAKYNGPNAKIYYLQPNYTWINNNGNWLLLSANTEPDSIFPNNLNLFSSINNVSIDENNNVWVVDSNTQLFKMAKNDILNYKSDFSAFIRSFTGINGQQFMLSGSELDKNNHSLKIRISAPYFIKSNSNQYQYFVSGVSREWTGWSPSPVIDFFVLKSGNYELKVRAKNIFGNVSNEQVISFRIKPAFYETLWFMLLCVIAFTFTIWMFIRYREQALTRQNEILEEKVKERTRQIEEQKEEIETQRDLIAGQNLEITDSIRYAKRIQSAVMPSDDVIATMLSNYFILFKPKDIVSGDFYWINERNNKIIVAVADCTGHGVPGGFLSMLGISLLNEISVMDKEFKANEILNLLRYRVKKLLTHEGHEETKDGMDIALCIIDISAKTVQYAGANNPLYIIRNGEIFEHAADKMPIGVYIGEKESFTNNDISLQTNDVLYLFSDGYRDQFGGEEGKRLKSGPFKKLLIEAHSLPVKKQKELLTQKHNEWRGNMEQVDDILLMGIKI